jgi:hypothetical protein
VAWATATEQTPNCRHGSDIAADDQKRHGDQHARRRRQQQHHPGLLNRQICSGLPRKPHLEPHMCATATAKKQKKLREITKGICHVHQCARTRAQPFS